MSSFDVRPDMLEKSAFSMRSMYQRMNALSQEVGSIGSSLMSDVPEVAPVVILLSKEVLARAVSMNSLAGAIATIASSYRNTDLEIAGIHIDGRSLSVAGQSAASDGWNQIWEKIKKTVDDIKERIRRALVEIGIIRAERQTRREGEEVTEWQEREQNLYMQREVFNLQKEDRFSRETWENASASEREQIIREYLEEVSRIMGLPTPMIVFQNMPADAQGYVTMGYYTLQDDPEGSRNITINSWMLNDSNANNYDGGSYGLLQTTAHEMRHYYQQYTIQHRDQYVVTEDTMNEWQDSFDNYRSTEDFMDDFNLSQDEAFQRYQDQSVERDARWFAGQD